MTRSRPNGPRTGPGSRAIETTGPGSLWLRPGLASTHNALAALGAAIDPLALAHALVDADADDTMTAEAAGVLVVDSRAGHPTDIAADLTAAHAIASARKGRVLLGYQPDHDTRAEGPAIGRALATAYAVMVLPAAGSDQPARRGVHRLIADAATAAGSKATVAKNPATAATVPLRVARHGDVLIAMGPGQDTAQLGSAAPRQLAGRPPARPAARR